MSTLDDYCNCGAQHGTIDGSYKCTDSCMATDIQALITEARIEGMHDGIATMRKAHEKAMKDWVERSSNEQQ